MNQNSDALGVFVKAADKHRSQRRKDVDGSPSINHPIALAKYWQMKVALLGPVRRCGRGFNSED